MNGGAQTTRMKLNGNVAATRGDVKIIRWHGGQHPTFQSITRKMEAEGLRPYAWRQGPNFRHAVRSHGYGKVLYCVEGTLEIILPDFNQRVVMRPGDRLELPRGVRYATVVGPQGAHCVEGELTSLLS
jgi:hypothetical protein